MLSWTWEGSSGESDRGGRAEEYLVLWLRDKKTTVVNPPPLWVAFVHTKEEGQFVGVKEVGRLCSREIRGGPILLMSGLDLSMWR
jgi:hypothetical protein